LYIVLNGADEEMDITLPEWPETGRWPILLDTAAGEGDSSAPRVGSTCKAKPRSVLVFAGAR
jgi:hypothetical protein